MSDVVPNDSQTSGAHAAAPRPVRAPLSTSSTVDVSPRSLSLPGQQTGMSPRSPRNVSRFGSSTELGVPHLVLPAHITAERRRPVAYTIQADGGDSIDAQNALEAKRRMFEQHYNPASLMLSYATSPRAIVTGVAGPSKTPPQSAPQRPSCSPPSRGYVTAAVSAAISAAAQRKCSTPGRYENISYAELGASSTQPQPGSMWSHVKAARLAETSNDWCGQMGGSSNDDSTHLRNAEHQVCRPVSRGTAMRHRTALQTLASRTWTIEELASLSKRGFFSTVAALLEHPALQRATCDVLCTVGCVRPATLSECVPALLQALPHALGPCAAGSAARRAALRVLQHLALAGRSAATAAAAACGVITPTCTSLTGADVEAARLAGEALCQLCADVTAAQLLMNAGVLDYLCHCFVSRAKEADPDERLTVALAGCLAHFAAIAPAAQRAVKVHSILPPLTALLSHGGSAAATAPVRAAALTALATFCSSLCNEVRTLTKTAVLDDAEGRAVAALVSTATTLGRLRSSERAMRLLWASGTGETHVRDKWLAAPHRLATRLLSCLHAVSADLAAARCVAGKELAKGGGSTGDTAAAGEVGVGTDADANTADASAAATMVTEQSGDSDLLLEDSMVLPVKFRSTGGGTTGAEATVASASPDKTNTTAVIGAPVHSTSAAQDNSTAAAHPPTIVQAQLYLTAGLGLLSCLASSPIGVKACLDGGVGGVLTVVIASIDPLSFECREQLLCLACNLCLTPAGAAATSASGLLQLALNTLAAVQASLHGGAGAAPAAAITRKAHSALTTCIKDQDAALALVRASAGLLANYLRAGTGCSGTNEGADGSEGGYSDGFEGEGSALGSTALDPVSTASLLCGLLCARVAVAGSRPSAARSDELRALAAALAGLSPQLGSGGAGKAVQVPELAAAVEALTGLLKGQVTVLDRAAASTLWCLLRHGVVHPDTVVRRLLEPLGMMLRSQGGDCKRQKADAVALVEVLCRSVGAGFRIMSSPVAESLKTYYLSCLSSHDCRMAQQMLPLMMRLKELGGKKQPADKYKLLADRNVTQHSLVLILNEQSWKAAETAPVSVKTAPLQR